jgi:hypothetical protein
MSARMRLLGLCSVALLAASACGAEQTSTQVAEESPASGGAASGTEGQASGLQEDSPGGSDAPTAERSWDDFQFEIDLPAGFVQTERVTQTTTPPGNFREDALAFESRTGIDVDVDAQLWTYARSYVVPTPEGIAPQMNVVVKSISLDVLEQLAGNSKIEEVETSAGPVFRITNDSPWVEYRWDLGDGLTAAVVGLGIEDDTLIEVVESFQGAKAS